MNSSRRPPVCSNGRCALLFAVAAMSLGCAEEAPKAATLSPGLRLELADDAAPLEPTATVATFDATDRSVGWVVEGTRPFVRPYSEDGSPGGDGPRVLTLRSQGDPIDVILPPRLDPATFNAVELEVATPHHATARLSLEGSGGPPIHGKPLPTPSDRGMRTLRFELPRVPSDRTPFEHVRIRFHGVGWFALASVTLLREDLHRRIPLPESGPALLPLAANSQHETRARRAVGLSSERPLKGLRQIVGGCVLTFSVGVPRALELPGRGARPILTVLSRPADAEGSWTTLDSFPVPVPDPGADPWTQRRIELPSGLGPNVSLRFELSSDLSSPAYAALGDPRIDLPVEDPPTVLLVTSDTHRFDHVAGSPLSVDVQTPVLEALASRGVRFENCLSTTNVTTPSHVAMMTGTHPRDTGVHDNHTRIRESAPTLAEAFRAAGYRTWAFVSADHLGGDRSGLGQGFERFDLPDREDGRLFNASDQIGRVLHALAEADGTPLFLWVHLFDAHAPYLPPGDWDRSYYGHDSDPFDPSQPRGVLPAVLPKFLQGLRDPRFPRDQYRAEVSFLDHELAALFDAPRVARGIIAFTADHGENLGQHGIFYGHTGLYSDTVHVPLILAWPGAPSGSRIAAPVSHLDLGRSLLDLSGLESALFPGASWLPVTALTARPPSARFTLSSHLLSAAITTDRWHLILYLEGYQYDLMLEPREKHQVELFDLGADPRCEHDVLDEHPEEARGLRERLIGWLDHPRPTGWAEDSAWTTEQSEQMAALGYVEGTGESPDRLFDPECTCVWCERFRGD